MIYRALSLWQPFASLVAAGLKAVETRSWDTRYRGPLLIHATARSPQACLDLASTEPFASYLHSLGYARFADLPHGVILAMTDLRLTCATEYFNPTPLERAFGDYSPGRFAWLFGPVQRLDTPIPAQGHQRLWTYVDPGTETQVAS